MSVRIAILCCLLAASVGAQTTTTVVPLSSSTVVTETDTVRTDVSATITVVTTPIAPPPPPPAWSFTVEPSTIVAGEAAAVRFTTTSADVHSITINGQRPTYTCGPETCAGSLPVAPTETTAYALTTFRADGQPWPALAVTLAVTPKAVESEPDPVPVGGLLQKEHLVYEGSFYPPAWADQNCPGCRFGYPPVPGGALWYDAETQTLWAPGNVQMGLVGQMTVPELRDVRTQALLTATLVQPFGDPTDGKYTVIGGLGGNSYNVGGLARVGDRLYLNGFQYYDANKQQPASLFYGGLDLRVTDDAVGPLKIGSRKVGETSGYIAPIPRSWQERVKATHCVGHWGMSIISRTSMGPACFATSFVEKDGGIEATPLLVYPYEQPPLGAYDTQNLFNNGTTRPGGLAWPEGTDSLLFFMRHGIGPFCYGSYLTNPATGCNPPLPNSTYAPPYVDQVLAFDAKTLLACRETPGCNPWTIRPYARWEFEFPVEPSAQDIGGVAYDAARQRIYLSQRRKEQTTIHVYKVTVP